MSLLKEKLEELDIKLEKEEIAKVDQIPIINFLRNCSCCSRCILMFIIQRREGVIGDYIVADERLLRIEGNDNPFSPPPKKIKKEGFCICCLGILEDEIVEKFVSMVSIQESRFQHIGVYLPKCVFLRNHSVFLHLMEKFPHLHYRTDYRYDIVLKRVLKLLIIDILVKKGIQFDSTSEVRIEFRIAYENDNEESKDLTSKVQVVSFIESTDPKTFKEKYPVPPPIPFIEPTVEIFIDRDPLHLGGRYLKFSRNIGQTPWVINGRRIMESSVQEIIFDSVKKILGCNCQMTFTASGREDGDVRMLGNGRPFFILINSPRTHNITFDQCRQIEEDIAESGKVAVIRLQKVKATQLKKIKEGENFKNKKYSAICQITDGDVHDAISKINVFKSGINIKQLTPLRVVHRRSLFSRDKVIYSIEAKPYPGHSDLIELILITQAGTYVKEFVHSDFNRTKPSIAEIIGKPIDILALDVLEVYLDWP